jgi:hypothetical protein
MFLEVLLPIDKCRLDVLTHLELLGIGSENESAPKISLPLLEDRSQIKEKDVICLQCQIWGFSS